MTQPVVRCKYDKMVSLGALKAHPKNRNRHGTDQIDRLAQILAYQGWRYPIKVSKRSGYVTSGHGRIEAAKHNGWERIPVNYQDYDSEEQEYADVQADNAIASWAELDLAGINQDIGDLGPDFDVDLLGIKGFEIEPADKFGTSDADHVPDAPEEPRTRKGDLYVLGNHRLLCGDAVKSDDVVKLIEKAEADLVFTSPPYLDQRDYRGGVDLKPSYLSGILGCIECDLWVVNLGIVRSDGAVLRYWDIYIDAAEGSGLKLLSWNVWDRSGSGYTIGQATAMFTIDHEFLFVFGTQKIDLNKTVPNKQSGVSKKGTIRQKDGTTTPVYTTTGGFRQMGTVIKTDVARYVGDDHAHPAMFPVELPQKYIEACTQPRGAVYDPFGGSGSTLIACEKTGRKCFMMEIDPAYCDVIVDRWEKYTGQKADLINAEGEEE